MTYDVAIVGGGPAGSTCAAFCAEKGLRTIIFEREKFPREKVCGDCINPLSWPVLRRLGVEDKIREAQHSALDRVEFINVQGERRNVRLVQGEAAEIAIKRSLFDSILLNNASKRGAEIRENETVQKIVQARSDEVWELTANSEKISARYVVAADGRNSTVARALGLLRQAKRDRIALQAHVPRPANFGRRIVLQLLPGGYSGQAPVNDHELNLCLVGRASALPQLKGWAIEHFNLAPELQWRSIAPLTRKPIRPAHENLFLIGDAARVVEPFTGEGIAYALNTGEMAADMIHRLSCGANKMVTRQEFRRAYAALYRGRLWINALARTAVVSPAMGSALFQISRWHPALLRLLTAKIVR